MFSFNFPLILTSTVDTISLSSTSYTIFGLKSSENKRRTQRFYCINHYNCFINQVPYYLHVRHSNKRNPAICCHFWQNGQIQEIRNIPQSHWMLHTFGLYKEKKKTKFKNTKTFESQNGNIAPVTEVKQILWMHLCGNQRQLNDQMGSCLSFRCTIFYSIALKYVYCALHIHFKFTTDYFHFHCISI